MQFKVPQFIDIEDKVFGPLTFKQFAYLAGGAGFAYLAFHFLPIVISIFVGPAIAAFAAVLAFIKYNDKPFIHTVEAFVKFYSRSRLYLWHKQSQPGGPIPMKPTGASPETMPGRSRDTLTESKLKTLSWSLDVIDPKNNQ